MSSGVPDGHQGFDRALLGEVVDRAPDGVVVVDAEGVICYWNAGAERIFGFSSAQAVGENLNLIIPERLRDRHWTAFRQAVSAGTSKYGDEDLLAVPAMTADRRTISIEFTVVLLHTGDRVGHIGAVIRDVTGRRSLELELRKRIRQLEEAE
ncbi:MAG: PAS domain S-box protein [Acidimicrobiaceae bacterium]|nr:PAS domain S-box protein [Acidimicrobiaceae bacterium]